VRSNQSEKGSTGGANQMGEGDDDGSSDFGGADSSPMTGV
jgi:hypothetical protein